MLIFKTFFPFSCPNLVHFCTWFSSAENGFFWVKTNPEDSLCKKKKLAINHKHSLTPVLG